VWALKDVSFEVRRGEVLGIIGRNGAGKSTLLKILSRITAPTTGRVKVKGRIASLLEVGTGMHPELTGRENIYLNGAILGMTKAEITRKLDEIIAFSGVERFIDTPVKRYSSGMMVRLGFAVAAHLEPEILIVDEVLAVGDAEFQKKCLGKMSEVAHGGRTVLFVSHNMAAVESLTRRCLMFDAGELREVGDTPDVIAAYLGSSSKGDLGPGREPPDVRSGNGKARICSVCCYGPDLRPVDGVQCGRPLGIQVRYAVSRPTAALCLRMTVYTSARTPVAHLDSAISGVTLGQTEGSHVVRCHVDCLNLAPGRYFLNVGLEDPEGVADHLEEAVFLVVWASDYLGTGKLPTQHGVVVFRARWSVTGI
jgi:lipopolysaccharide transport system ATP-binding protein